MPEKKQRLLYVDMAKSVALILVVYSHILVHCGSHIWVVSSSLPSSSSQALLEERVPAGRSMC